jgi:hypothetical protein
LNVSSGVFEERENGKLEKREKKGTFTGHSLQREREREKGTME